MQNPNPKDDDDLLTFSLSCNRPKRETHSFPTNPPPLTMQTPFINPMLVPFTASNHNNMDAVDHVHVNAPVPSSSRSRRRAARNHPSALSLGHEPPRHGAHPKVPFGEQDRENQGERGVQEVQERVRDGS